METGSVFITGANRGIGLEFVSQFVGLEKPPKFLFATYRNKDTIQELEKIQNKSEKCKIILIRMDARNSDDLKSARKIVEDTVGNDGLNLLINNAGAVNILFFKDLTEEDLLFHFKNNTIAPIMVMKEFLPLLQMAAKQNSNNPMSISKAAVLNMTSMAGSIENVKANEFAAVISYRTSKAALNMAMRIAAAEVKDEGILVVNMCPGWVKTRMGTDMAKITTLESISAMLETLPKLNESHQGSYIDRFGEPINF